MGTTSCMTCRGIRRSLVSFGLAGLLAWQLTGALPAFLTDVVVWQVLLVVVMMFSALNVMITARRLLARLRRQRR